MEWTDVAIATLPDHAGKTNCCACSFGSQAVFVIYAATQMTRFIDTSSAKVRGSLVGFGVP